MIDGREISLLLMGGEGEETPRKRFFYQQADELAAVRTGDRKLFVNLQLCNKKDDLSEHIDLAAANSSTASELKAYPNQFASAIESSARPFGVELNAPTLVPWPGVEGEEGDIPSLDLP